MAGKRSCDEKLFQRFGQRVNAGRYDMKKHEILLALSDDNSHSFMAIASALEDMGHHVTSEMDGNSAIEKLLRRILIS
jgi:hypothetical protein